jgi:prolyl-tRNA synthetase
LRLTVGARGLKENAVELQERATGERCMLPLARAAAMVREQIDEALGRDFA